MRPGAISAVLTRVSFHSPSYVDGVYHRDIYDEVKICVENVYMVSVSLGGLAYCASCCAV